MQEYDFEISGSRDDIAAVLVGVADGLAAGSIRLGTGEAAVAVDAPTDLDLEVELETDDDEVSLELELEWSLTAGEGVTDADAVDQPANAAAADAADPDGPDASTADADAESSGSEAHADPATEADASPDTEQATAVGAADGTQSLARFEVFQDRAAEWRWRLRHHNGNIIATSGEGYTRKHNARKGLRSVIANAPGAELIDESG